MPLSTVLQMAGFPYFLLLNDFSACGGGGGECFLGGTSGKELACQCRRYKRCGFDPWVGKISLEKEMAVHSSIPAWRIPWTEESGGLQVTESRTGLKQLSMPACVGCLLYPSLTSGHSGCFYTFAIMNSATVNSYCTSPRLWFHFL